MPDYLLLWRTISWFWNEIWSNLVSWLGIRSTFPTYSIVEIHERAFRKTTTVSFPCMTFCLRRLSSDYNWCINWGDQDSWEGQPDNTKIRYKYIYSSYEWDINTRATHRRYTNELSRTTPQSTSTWLIENHVTHYVGSLYFAHN